MNFQAGHYRLQCLPGLRRRQWLLIDIGYDDTVEEIVELIRQLDFPLSHARRSSPRTPTSITFKAWPKPSSAADQATAHPLAATRCAAGTAVQLRRNPGPDIDMELPPVEVEHEVNEGDLLQVGGLELEVWLTPGHTDCQLCFRLGDLLFSGDNIYRDGCVGAIDAHHGSDLPAFVQSLQRIRASDVQWLLPSHGPYFRKDDRLLDAVITRLQRYQHMADFGTCAAEWPLMDQWEQELAAGKRPN